MAFRDDRKAARLRANVLEDELEEAQEALEAKDQRLKELEAQVEALKNSAPEPIEPHAVRQAVERPGGSVFGLVTLGCALAGVGFMGVSIPGWSDQVATLRERMTAAGRGHLVDTMNLFNQVYVGLFMLLGLGLVWIGIAQVRGREWWRKATFFWGLAALVFVVADVIGTRLISGRINWEALLVTGPWPVVCVLVGARHISANGRLLHGDGGAVRRAPPVRHVTD